MLVVEEDEEVGVLEVVGREVLESVECLRCRRKGLKRASLERVLEVEVVEETVAMLPEVILRVGA